MGTFLLNENNDTILETYEQPKIVNKEPTRR